MDRLLEYLLIAAVMLLAVITNGLALSWLWLWFITPFGLPSISYIHALGLSLFSNFMLGTQGQPGVMIVSPLIALLIGYILQFWM